MTSQELDKMKVEHIYLPLAAPRDSCVGESLADARSDGCRYLLVIPYPYDMGITFIYQGMGTLYLWLRPKKRNFLNNLTTVTTCVTHTCKMVLSSTAMTTHVSA